MKYDSPEMIRERFNNRVSDYTAGVVSTIPNFQLSHKMISTMLGGLISKKVMVSILDLGTGVGSVPQRIAEDYPTVQFNFTLVDFAENMLNHASEIMSDYQLVKLRTHCLDIRYFNYEVNEYDAVVTSLALHHLRPGEKLHIYPKIFSSIKPGGLFLNFDMFAEPDPEWEALSRDEWREYIHMIGWSNYSIHQMYEEVFEGEDSPETIEAEFQMLRKAGFTNISLISKNYLFGLLAARKL